MRDTCPVPRIALALLTAIVAGLLGAGAAHAADKPKPPAASRDRITFGAQPAYKGAPDKRPGYRYIATPGGLVRDQVAVRNLSTVPVTFQVYPTDAINVDNGGFGLLPKAQRPRDVGRWVTIGNRGFKGTVTVKARSVAILPVSLTVPADAQPGDHTGGIVVSVTTRTKNAKGTNTELDQRVGVRMYLRVSGPLRPELTIKPVRADYQGTLNPLGRATTDVTYRVTNTGNVNLGGRQAVSVRGLVGPTQLSRPIPDAELLLPGGSMEVKTTVPQTWPLIWERATVSVNPLVQPGDPVTGLTRYVGTTNFWAVPWTLLAIIAALLLLLGFLIRRRVKRRRRPVAQAATSAPVGERTAARRSAASTTLTLAATLALASAALASPALAAEVPYTDPAATGGITLCDAQGRPKTSGRLNEPMAATVVGGSPAVAPYDGNGRSAALYAYQPRRGVDPGEWSGMGMTALSRYTNPKRPMVEILPRDYTMQGFVRAYTPKWDGLVQLRIYLRVPNESAETSSYAATNLKVTGSSWQQVGPDAGASCRTGEAKSVVRLLGLPTEQPTNTPKAAAASPTTSPPPSATRSDPAAKTGAATGAPPPSGGGQPSPDPQSAGATQASGDGSALTWALPVGALLVIAGFVWWLGRRRPRQARP